MTDNSFITTSSAQTKKLGQMLAKELRGGEIICLSGDLGAGKTTFTQGLLRGLKIKGPYTSPTFLIIKNYKKEFPMTKSQFSNKSKISKSKIKNIYHIDAYRVNADDILNLAWKDFAGKPDSIVVIEWPERIKKIIPTDSVWKIGRAHV
jgi:tRNA threonylcarbamoyladenosine biosynthesis protein TsaE